MLRSLYFILSIFFACLLLAPRVEAQEVERVAEYPFEPTVRAAVIDSVLQHLERSYIFLDTARVMAEVVRAHQESLEALADPEAFADSLTARLRAVSRDRHLAVYYDPGTFEALKRPEEEAGADGSEEARRAEERARNYGFRRVDLLEGNVGYVELTRFDEPDTEAGARAVAAMTLVSDAAAVIIDLRQNPGGSGRMGQLLSSYFFDGSEDQWLISNVNRSRGTSRQEWTLPYVPGQRMPETPLYLLVGSQTGSAAEGFAYNLQALGRALIVGEPTYGAAHSGSMVPLTGGFVMFLPTGRTVNPITGTNWEWVGVQPDVEVKADDALTKALSLIWKQRLSQAGGKTSDANRAEWMLDYLNAKLEPIEVDSALLQEYAGMYEGARAVLLVGEGLYYRREGQPAYQLLPLSEDTFVIEGLDRYGPGNYRVTFLRDANGKVSNMRMLIRHTPTEVAVFENPRLQ